MAPGSRAPSPCLPRADRQRSVWRGECAGSCTRRLCRGVTILFFCGRLLLCKYMVRSRKPPSQTWRTFLENHAQQLVSIDFFTAPTIRFQVLYVFLVLAHGPASHSALQCDRPSNRGVDGTATAGGIPL